MKRQSLAPTWVLTAVIAAIGSAACAEDTPPTRNGLPLIFDEDFESGDSRWRMTDPKAWAIVEEDGNHVLALQRSSDYEPKVRSPLSIALASNLNVGSFVLEATLKQTGRDYNHRDLCLFFGHNGPSKFYYLHLATKADDHAHSIFLVNDAARVSVADERTGGVAWDDEYHLIRVTRDAESGQIKVFFDDMERPIMQTVDKTFLTGAIGLGSFDDTGTFDNIRLWAETE